VGIISRFSRNGELEEFQRNSDSKGGPYLFNNNNKQSFCKEELFTNHLTREKNAHKHPDQRKTQNPSKGVAMIEIDGRKKSGSGTIVRDGIAFSILRGERLHLTNIRTKRDKPGLRAQHLKALQASVKISEGGVKGVEIGSKEVAFTPGTNIRGGEFQWDIGTAGSTIMLALTLIPVALFADTPSRYRITGGLFQDFAPSAFHLQHVLLPTLRRMGAQIQAEIIRPGYVPKGGGIIEVTVAPTKEPLKPLNLVDQGHVVRIRGIALSSLLGERRVSERMAEECRRSLKNSGCEAVIDILNDGKGNPAYQMPSVQPGAALAIWDETDTGCVIGSDMAGARGRSAEYIGGETARNLLEDMNTGATVDRHLADQLIPFAALAGGWTDLVIPRMTDHVETRLWLAEEILGAVTEVQGNLIRIKGIGYARKACQVL
jgi:RNA 3'-terminal phosphate cyclase (ATP)